MYVRQKCYCTYYYDVIKKLNLQTLNNKKVTLNIEYVNKFNQECYTSQSIYNIGRISLHSNYSIKQLTNIQ